VSETGGEVEVLWTLSPDTGGEPITSFHIVMRGRAVDGSEERSFKEEDETFDARIERTAPDSIMSGSFRRSRLQHSTSYRIYLIAENSMGKGPKSPELVVVTRQQITSPAHVGLPMIIESESTGGAVTFQWTMNVVRDTGGQGGVDWFVLKRGGNQVCTMVLQNGTQLQRLPADAGVGTPLRFKVTVAGLSSGETYSFALQAENAAGVSLQQKQLWHAMGQPTPCDPPLLTVASSTGGMVTLQWTAAPDSGGSPLKAFVVELKRASEGKEGKWRRAPCCSKATTFQVAHTHTAHTHTGTHGLIPPAAVLPCPSCCSVYPK
jgi:hypothetical protein